jgi:hypothetical protein
MREVVATDGNDLIVDHIFIEPASGSYLVAFTPEPMPYYIGTAMYSGKPSCALIGNCDAIDTLTLYNITPTGGQGDNLDPIQAGLLNGKHVAVYSDWSMLPQATLETAGPGRTRVVVGLEVTADGHVNVELDRPYQLPKSGDYVVTAHYEGSQLVASGEAYYINTTGFTEADNCMFNGMCPPEVNQLGVYQANPDGTKGAYQDSADFLGGRIYVLDNWAATENCVDMCNPGESYPSVDGCNTCSCPDSGKKSEAVCTAMTCQPNQPGQ